ncbi:MAG: response regulator [Vicinamibacterales bacterium]
MTVTTPRLLVVSESRITRRVVEMTFADQAVELVTASTGPDGLAEWERHPASVVIADLAMDGLDGLSLARTLADRAGERAPSVLLMAGQNDVVDDAAVVAAGVRAVLRKPLDSLQLVDAVRSATRAGRPPEPPPASDPVASTGSVETASAPGPAVAPVPEPAAAAPGAGVDLGDEDLERVAARVAAIWSGDVQREQRVAALMAERAEQVAASSAAAAVERVAPAAASEAAERLVRELAPKLVAEVARLVVADVSERLVREEIARMRAAHPGR